MMPRKRDLKTNRVSIDEGNIKRAIINVFNGGYSERRAAIVYEIKRSTLQSRIKQILRKKTKEEYLRQHTERAEDSGNDSIDEDSPKYSSKYTVRQVFTNDQELELVKYIKRCSDINYGLTYTNVQKLAYQYTIVLPNCKIPPEWHKAQQAKEGWRRGFMQRHQSLSLRKPESTSLSRSVAFNKHKVDQFFENYKSVLDRFKFPPERIFNLDETGVTTVLKPVKLVTTCGKKQVSQVASAERGELVTFVGIINAAGQSLPPVYLFPRIRNLENFMVGAPVSSLALGNKSGWMTAETFPQVLKHIVTQTNCSVDNPILILLDNHESHVSLNAVKYCKENGICLVSFPPHTTHRLQPLDVGIYGPFKSYCGVAFNDWLTSNPGKTISIKNIPSLTSLAYLKAFSAVNIISSFKKPGIWPLNRLVFSYEDFLSSYVTDKPPLDNKEQNVAEATLRVNNKNEEENVIEGRQKTTTEEETIDANLKEKDTIEMSLEDINERSKVLNQNFNVLNTCSGVKNHIKIKITPEVVRPYPKVEKKQTKTKREPGKSRIYTDTPEKARLEEIENSRSSKIKKVVRKVFSSNELATPKTTNKTSIKKRRLEELDSTSSESDISLNDNSDDDISDELESLKEINGAQLKEQDFVLVRFPVKHTVRHFVGQILTTSTDAIHTVKFLRWKGLSTTFYFPVVEDISNVDSDDIVAKLTPPLRSATARTSSYFQFCYNFSNLVVN